MYASILSSSGFFISRGNERCSRLAKAGLWILACLLPIEGNTQEETFLRCADFSERDARVSCLERALEQAVNSREARQAQPAAPVAPAQQSQAQQAVAPTPPTTPSAPSTSSEAVSQQQSGGFELFGLFDRESEEEEQIREAQRVADTMRAKVAELDFFKQDILTISLDNGQVWRQRYPKRYNLREGDAISIYLSGWGGHFRLESERINGFIQVERLR